MSKENAITMLKHWILEAKHFGFAPGISDLAAIIEELETNDMPMGSAIYEQRLTNLEAWMSDHKDSH